MTPRSVKRLPESALLRRMCSKCRQPKATTGGKVEGVHKRFTCKECR